MLRLLFALAASPAAASSTETAIAALDAFRLDSPPQQAEQLDAMSAHAEAFSAAGDDSMSAVVWSELGWAMVRNARAEESQPLFARAVEKAVRFGDAGFHSSMLNNQAVGWAAAGDLEPAVTTWLSSVPMGEAAEDTLRLSRVWSNIANAYSLMGRYPEAKEAGARARFLSERSGNRFGVGVAYLRLAAIERELGRLASAIVAADSAIAILDSGTSFGRRATIKQEMGDSEGALRDFERAIELAEVEGDGVAALSARSNRAITLARAGQYERAIDLVDELLIEVEPGDPAHNQLTSLRGWSQYKLGDFDGAEAVLTDALNTFETYRTEFRADLSRAGISTRGGDIYGKLAELYWDTDRRTESFLIQERGSRWTLTERLGHGGETTDIDSLAAMLGGANAAYLHVAHEPGLNPRLFVVSADGLRTASTVASFHEQRALARALTDVLSVGGDDAMVNTLARKLGRSLFGPALELIPDTVERVYLVLPGSIDGLPVSAVVLPDGGEGVEFGDRFAITLVPNARILLGLLEKRLPPPLDKAVLAIADPTPILSAGPGASFVRPPLPYARAEVNGIASSITRFLIGDEATAVATVAALEEGATVVHFATHAEMHPTQPEGSALLLADHPLTAVDIETLDVSADLVALSACRSLGGHPVMGEGAFGLSRSFFVAGARSVVSTLWKVEDQASATFMREFYRELRDGEPRDHALRRARLSLRASGFPPSAQHAFVLSGVGHLPVDVLVGKGEGRFPRFPPAATTSGLVLLLGGLAIALEKRRRSGTANR